MEHESHTEASGLLRRVIGIAAEIVVAIYVVLDGIVAPLFRPVMRFLSSLALVRRLERVIASLPPYVILGLLVVPFALAEVAKVYAVFLMAEDHVRTGVAVFVAAYVVSILVCERTFHAGRDQLMTIGWFKASFGWVMRIKARALDWLRTTRVWRLASDLRRRMGVSLGQMRARLLSIFGPRSKGIAQRR